MYICFERSTLFLGRKERVTFNYHFLLKRCREQGDLLFKKGVSENSRWFTNTRTRSSKI